MSAITADLSGTNGGRGLRRAWAIFAGLLAIVTLSIATDAVLHATGVFPPIPQRMPDALFVVAISYRLLYSVGGCYLAARLAPDHPMRHALAIGVIGLVTSTAGAAAMWDFGPAWYSLGNIAMAIPCAWLGGRLFEAGARK
jgi:hypothetical protein